MDWYLATATIGIVLATLASRSGMWLLPAAVEIPPTVQRALRYAPSCALAGIIGTALFLHNGAIDVSWSNDALLGAIAGTAVFAKTKNMLAMMAAGMMVLTLARLT